MGMYKQVVKDKTQIETTITKLVGYKIEALKNTWEIVNASVSLLAPTSNSSADWMIRRSQRIR